MKERILQTLSDLRTYALDKGCDVSLFYHEEDSYLMRFANSAISLNTNEHLIRLEITAYSGRKRASYELITDLGKLDEMKHGIDIAAEMVQHAQPLSLPAHHPAISKVLRRRKRLRSQAWRGSATTNGWSIFNQAVGRPGEREDQAFGHLFLRHEYHRPDHHPLGTHPVFQDLRCPGDRRALPLPTLNGK